MPFFIKNSRKRVLKSKESYKSDRKKQKATTTRARRPYVGKKNNEEIDSDSGSDFDGKEKFGKSPRPELDSHEVEVDETAEEKKLRLTKEYLKSLEEVEKESMSECESDDSGDGGGGRVSGAAAALVSNKLSNEMLKKKGRLFKTIADMFRRSPPEEESVVSPTNDGTHIYRGHKMSVTCLVLTSDREFVFSGSKDCAIIKWSRRTGSRLKVIPGGAKKNRETTTTSFLTQHTSAILSLALSSHDHFLASGDAGGQILIWNAATPECQFIRHFKGHRQAVTGLAFRMNTNQLFSGALDRMIKVWNLDEMAYMETLFGHEEGILCVDALMKDRAVSCGGRDRSVRVWKIVEESQLVFHGHRSAIDCVTMITDQHFMTGSDDNTLGLWSLMKKKPLCLVQNAHSRSPVLPSSHMSTVSSSPSPPTNNTNTSTAAMTISAAATVALGRDIWISSVAACRYTDLVASGSNTGSIILWKCCNDYKSLCKLFQIPVIGFINSLTFDQEGTLLVAALGQEHRMGRWTVCKAARNGIAVIDLLHFRTDYLAIEEK